ncbi:MAG: 2-C-methyl-D-erythritol 4-phosphate cytidylyltransferase [Candidatus Limnocylindrales bacterium]
MSVAVVIVAAGGGRRMGASMNKIFLPIDGTPILAHTIAAFETMPIVDSIVLVASAADHARCVALVRDGGHGKVASIVTGGDTRHDSEARGLAALAGDVAAGRIDTILVHDAVRPFVRQAVVERLVHEAQAVGAAIPAIPIGGPLVSVDGDDRLAIADDDLWIAQTPQAFRASRILEAHRRAGDEGFVGTDTASVVERLGDAVAIVVGHADNLKITTPDDLIRAECILAARAAGTVDADPLTMPP